MSLLLMNPEEIDPKFLAFTMARFDHYKQKYREETFQECNTPQSQHFRLNFDENYCFQDVSDKITQSLALEREYIDLVLQKRPQKYIGQINSADLLQIDFQYKKAMYENNFAKQLRDQIKSLIKNMKD